MLSANLLFLKSENSDVKKRTLVIFCFIFSFQFLEQERHRLRQQLELMEDEYEQRIVELQSDIDTLKSKLAETDTSSRLKDSERSTLGEKIWHKTVNIQFDDTT